MSSSKKSALSEQYNHPFGHLFGKRINLHPDLEKIIFRAEEKDKVMLRELAQWSYLLNQVYNSYVRKDLRRRYATEEQWEEERKWYEKTAFEMFAVLKFFYQDRYEKYHELSNVYGIGKDNIAIMERLLKEEVESILIKGDDNEHTES
jgi:hypothetical protein